jgi:Tol biopolymer transport system component
MNLQAGFRLGPYEIVRLLGAGGMGEVYEARDTRLERAVAVKVLPADRLASTEARQRFEREARTTSQLAHPHICALYDVGRQESPQGPIDYLVMEYLEGETLEVRLGRGPLPLRHALGYAVDIADALDKAHRRGIVHRDLKPGNVMLTPSGVKLLDFGLAKAAAVAETPAQVTSLPTRANVTQQGTILGTLHYMSPEQLEGREADARSDLFAFGLVLYEMSTARKAFDGRSQASLISAIMTAEPPPISTLQPTAPPALDRFIAVCLAKDPENRWQSARDLGRELRFLLEAGPDRITGSLTSGEGRGLSRRFFGAAAFVLALAAATWIGTWLAPKAPEARFLRLSIQVPKGTSLTRGLALSPDGRRIAFVGSDDAGVSKIWIRSLDSASAVPLQGTEGAWFPFWSPDSRSVAFYADGRLRRVSVAGGDVQSLCDITDFRGGTWGSHGDILFTPDANAGIFRVSESGGPVTRVTTFDTSRQDESHRWPWFLPDGRHFLLLIVGGAPGIYVASLDGGPMTRVAEGSLSAPVHVAPGYVLYVVSHSLMAQPFDDRLGRSVGNAVPLAEGVWRDATIWGDSGFTASNSGLVAFRPGVGGEMELRWFDRTGRSLGTVGASGAFSEPSLSPDGRTAAIAHLDRQTGTQGIWLHDLQHGGTTLLSTGPEHAGAQTPVFSPDGTEVVFASFSHAGCQLLRKAIRSNGAADGETVLLTEKPGNVVFPDDWSAAGGFIVYEKNDPVTHNDLWAVDPASGEKRPLVVTEHNETHSSVSPDGRLLAYVSDETGRGEVCVQAIPSGPKWAVSSGGGDQPRWRPDGKELFFLSPARALMSADVIRTPSAIEFSTPRKLFATNFPEPSLTGNRNTYLVGERGERFLVTVSLEESNDIQVLTNWTGALTAKP